MSAVVFLLFKIQCLDTFWSAPSTTHYWNYLICMGLNACSIDRDGSSSTHAHLELEPEHPHCLTSWICYIFFSFQKSVHGHSLTIHTYYSLEFIDRAMSIERPSSEVLLRCSLSNGSWRSEASKWGTAVVDPQGISRNGWQSCRRINQCISVVCAPFSSISFWQDFVQPILWSRKTISRIISTFENVKFSRSIHLIRPCGDGEAGSKLLDFGDF